MAMPLTTLPSYKHWLPATYVPLEVEDPLTLSAPPVWYSELWLPWEFASQLLQCISIASHIAVLPIQFPTQLLDSHVTATNTTFDSFLFLLFPTQLIQGVRKCSNINVQYLGDPLLQPIRSFENATLVRWLYHISCHLNKRVGVAGYTITGALISWFMVHLVCTIFSHQYATQLAAVGSSDSLWSKLLLQLLAPPPPSLLTQPHTDEWYVNIYKWLF